MISLMHILLAFAVAHANTAPPKGEPVDPRAPQNDSYFIRLLRLSEAGAPSSDVMNYHLQMLKARSGSKQAYEPALDNQLQKYMDGVYRTGAPRTRAHITLIDQGACVVAASARNEDPAKCGEVAIAGSCLSPNKSVASCMSDLVMSKITVPKATRVAEVESTEAGR